MKKNAGRGGLEKTNRRRNKCRAEVRVEKDAAEQKGKDTGRI